jgi:glycosyltransferase involved in cell wall biosynthesis
MNKRATISIVTPSFNQGAFLAETIESVISQAGDFHIDYIIVDGCSTDGSLEIIRHYHDLLRRGEWPVSCRGITCRWLSEKDRGQTDALVKGFSLAQGDVLAWLNSDDTYLPGALQTVTEFFQGHPETGLVYGDACYCDAEGAILGNYRTEDFDLAALASATIICQPAAFFRREAFEAVGGLDATLEFVMDFDLWIKLGRQVSCRHIPVTLATYRLHATSKTISSSTLINNSEEALTVVIRHFGWAPLTRVYTACSIRCTFRFPEFLARQRVLLAVAACCCSIFRSLCLNRGLNRNDLRLLNRNNFRKLFRSRLELMTGRTP